MPSKILPLNFLTGGVADFKRWLRDRRMADDIEDDDDFVAPIPVKATPITTEKRPRKTIIARRKHIDPADTVAWIKAHQPCTVDEISRGMSMPESTVINQLRQLENRQLLDTSMAFANSAHSRPSKFYTVKEQVVA